MSFDTHYLSVLYFADRINTPRNRISEIISAINSNFTCNQFASIPKCILINLPITASSLRTSMDRGRNFTMYSQDKCIIHCFHTFSMSFQAFTMLAKHMFADSHHCNRSLQLYIAYYTNDQMDTSICFPSY